MYYIEILKYYGEDELGNPINLIESFTVTKNELYDILSIDDVDLRRIKRIRS